MGVGRQRIRIRRATAAEWISADPVLLDGELGLEQDTRRLKAGDGSSRWTELDYLVGLLDEHSATLGGLSDVTTQAAANGSLLVYDAESGQWVGGPAVTTLEIVNGGNY